MCAFARTCHDARLFVSISVCHAANDPETYNAPDDGCVTGCDMLLGPAGPLQCELCACAEKVTARGDLGLVCIWMHIVPALEK